jgi:hypothetical protein
MTLLFYQTGSIIQEVMGAGTATDYVWKMGGVFDNIKENASISTTRVEDNSKVPGKARRFDTNRPVGRQVVHLFFETHENGLAHREKGDSGWDKGSPIFLPSYSLYLTIFCYYRPIRRRR